MLNSKLVQICQQLSPVEFTQLVKFVQSPYHNQHQDVAQLCQYLKKIHPKFEDANCSKAVVFPLIYPKEKYNDEKIRNLMSYLTKHVESYLITSQLKKMSFVENQALLDAFKSKGLDKYYQAALIQQTKKQESVPYRDVEFYFDQHLLAEENYEYTLRTQNRKIGTSLQQLADNLDYYYLAKKLKYTCEIINRKNVLKEEYELTLVDELLGFLKNNSFEHVPIIQLYFQVLLTLTESDREEHYQELIRLLTEYTSLFPQDENRILYSFAQNYCIKKINSGKPDYLKEIFRLYQLSLKNKVLLDGNTLSQWDYKNIVTVGLRLGEIDWTENFIKEYKPLLPKSYQENAYEYNFANLNFYKREFGEAMLRLQRVEFTDVFYNLDSKSLLLKTYFEMDESEALFALATSFKNYLRRNKKVSQYQQLSYMNLVKYVNKLAKLRSNRRSLPEKLKLEIENSQQLADSTWLKSKLDGFKIRKVG